MLYNAFFMDIADYSRLAWTENEVAELNVGDMDIRRRNGSRARGSEDRGGMDGHDCKTQAVLE